MRIQNNALPQMFEPLILVPPILLLPRPQHSTHTNDITYRVHTCLHFPPTSPDFLPRILFSGENYVSVLPFLSGA